MLDLEPFLSRNQGKFLTKFGLAEMTKQTFLGLDIELVHALFSGLYSKKSTKICI